MFEPAPVLRVPILTAPYLRFPSPADANAQPLLDEDGQPLIDERGNVIHGE